MPACDILDMQSVPTEINEIISQAPLPGLGDSPKSDATRSAITNWMATDAKEDKLIESALWLLAGELDRSHSISQNVDTADGSYWHGIMHRREGDFWNSKYWFRRVGNHPVLSQLVEQIASQQAIFSDRGLPTRGLLSTSSVAATLVDLCETAVHERAAWESDLQRIFWWEWQLLFRHSGRF